MTQCCVCELCIINSLTTTTTARLSADILTIAGSSIIAKPINKQHATNSKV